MAVVAVVVAVLAVVSAVSGPWPGLAGASSPAPFAASLLWGESAVRPAPALDLMGSDGRAFSLGSLRGQRVLVFFGYTHCPDVCPTTIGLMGRVVKDAGPGIQVVFVTIDPERDSVAWLAEWRRQLPTDVVALTGTAAQIRVAADAWGVRYEVTPAATGAVTASGPTAASGPTPASPAATDYAMSHSADVFLLDAQGQLRASFPFGTGEPVFLDTFREMDAAAR